jgi:hypothetical protein
VARNDLVASLLRLDPPRREPPKPEWTNYTLESPPPDDAPLDVLGSFWSLHGDSRHRRELTLPEKTRERLLEAAIEQPSRTEYLFEFFPRTTAAHDRIKRLYDENKQQLSESSREKVRAFLMRNTSYFRGELVLEASKTTEHPVNGVEEHRADLEALSALDFARAEPILKRFAEDNAMPARAILAKGLLFAHYPDGPDFIRLTRELRQTAEDSNASRYRRGLALAAVVRRDWQGRDEWFLTLFRDPALFHPGDQPLAQVVAKNPDHLIPMVSRLIGNADRVVHDNAVACLAYLLFPMRLERRDVVEPLLPWLLDPKWAPSTQRRIFLIQMTGKAGVREAIPGLIAVLNQDVDMAERGYAADALGQFKEKSSVPALRQALKSTNRPPRPYRNPPIGFEGLVRERQKFMKALVDVGGLSNDETIAAIEAYVTWLEKRGPDATRVLNDVVDGWASTPIPDEVLIGEYLAGKTPLPPPPSGPCLQCERRFPEEIVELLLTRSGEIEANAPRTAKQLLEIAHQWSSVTGDRDIARRIEANAALPTSIQLALLRRDKFAANVPDALRGATALVGFPAGIFAALSADARREQSVLKGWDTDAIRALLACARLVRETLPLDLVERVYDSDDAGAQRAAEAYLMADDGVRAREILNARHKGSVIFGDRGSEEEFGLSLVFEDQEKQLLAMMKDDKAVDEVFALISWGVSEQQRAQGPSSTGLFGGASQIVIERRGNTATLMTRAPDGGENNRTLSTEEFARLKTFIDSEKVEDLGPDLSYFSHGGSPYEYIHLTRKSGRRVFMASGFGPVEVYDKLVAEFQRLAPDQQLGGWRGGID